MLIAQEKPYHAAASTQMSEATSGSAFTYSLFKEVTFHRPNYQHKNLFTECTECIWHLKNCFFLSRVSLQQQGKNVEKLSIYMEIDCVSTEM